MAHAVRSLARQEATVRVMPPLLRYTTPFRASDPSHCHITDIQALVGAVHTDYYGNSRERMFSRAPELMHFMAAMRPGELGLVSHHFAKMGYQGERLLGGGIPGGDGLMPSPTIDYYDEKGSSILQGADFFMTGGPFLSRRPCILFLADQLRTVVGTIDHITISVLLHGLGRLNEPRKVGEHRGRSSHRIPKEALDSFLDTCGDWIMANRGNLKVCAMGQSMQGFAKLKYYRDDLFTALAEKVREMAREFNLAQLSMVINAMARSLTHDWEAEEAVCLRLETILAEMDDSQLPEASNFIAGILTAFLKLEADCHPTLEETILRHLPRFMPLLSMTDIVLTVPSLARLVQVVPQREFLEAIFNGKCRQYITAYEKEGLGGIMLTAQRLGFTYDICWWEEAVEQAITTINRGRWKGLTAASVIYAVARLGVISENSNVSTEILTQFKNMRKRLFESVSPVLPDQVTDWHPRAVTTLLTACVEDRLLRQRTRPGSVRPGLRDTASLARRAPEFLELTPFLRGYELSMLANHFAMIKLQREDFWHALARKLIENGLPDPTPDDVALISDAYGKAQCFSTEVMRLLAQQLSVIESRLEAYPLSVLMMSLANMVEHREDNRLAPRPRQGFRSAARADADDMIDLLEPVAAWGFTKLRYSNTALYRSLAAATRLLAPEMSFEQVCANLASFNRLERHDRRAIIALLDRLDELPEDEMMDNAFLPSLVHVVGKLGLKTMNSSNIIARYQQNSSLGSVQPYFGLRPERAENHIEEAAGLHDRHEDWRALIRVLSMLPTVVHRPSATFLHELFAPGARCQRELRDSHDQTIISVIVEAANRLGYDSEPEFWKLVMETVPGEVAANQWLAEPFVKCFVAVAKLEVENYPVEVPQFFEVMEPMIVREIPGWNTTIVTALTWGLLWRKQALDPTVTAVLQFARENITTYDKADVYRLIRLLASLGDRPPCELAPLIEMVNQRIDQGQFFYSEYQCKLMSSVSTKLNGDIDEGHLHSKCWLQGLAGWLMVIGLVFGAVFNCFSSARAYTHPFAQLNLEAFEDFADFTNVSIKHIECAGLAATALYITAFAVLFRAVNSVSSSWRASLIAITGLALAVHAFGGWCLYETADALLRIEKSKSVEIGNLIQDPAFNLTNVTTSLQSFACTWETGSCQLGSSRVLNSACYMGTATARPTEANATGSFDAVLGQLCGPQSIFAVNGGLLPEPSTHCVQCDAAAVRQGIMDPEVTAAACGCLAGVGDFFTLYGYNYFLTMFIIGAVGFVIVFTALAVYLVVLIIMKSYGGWHFHEWFRESSDDSDSAEDEF
ncbi:hypothetical protein FOZ60_012388 [Perkinsus olseni]|uniref:Uncharacterized protein n=1 Tax=Perkinsus olseni TaxID=32597 RepID=A0A7J6PAU8_PEROL|nr:hypothetical protein FOZ60_012388 [Perkinsus olseni]